MSDMTPIFSIRDIYDEVYAIVDPLNTRVMMTYGSHDNNCTEGYDAFYSGPRRSDGYYTYGISYAQMVYDTDSATTAAIRYYQEHPDEQNDSIRPPQPEQGDSITGVVRCPLNFTYANAGYLKLGRASVITFTDTNGNGHYDMMELRRYSLDADQPDRQFGLTGKPNPYVITFPTRNN